MNLQPMPPAANLVIRSTQPDTSVSSAHAASDEPAEASIPPVLRSRPAATPPNWFELLNQIESLSPQEYVASGMPELISNTLQASEAAAAAAATRRSAKSKPEPFKYVAAPGADKAIVGRLAAARWFGQIPRPYPIDRDPLRLEDWVGRRSDAQVVSLARSFPELRSALFSYKNRDGVNHLAHMVHKGELIDIELDLFSKKQWLIIPAGDAVLTGPPANFIVLIKAALLHYDHRLVIPLARKSIVSFIEHRSRNDIVELIQCCNAFQWPPAISLSARDKAAFINETLDDPIEHLMIDLIVPALAMTPSKADLLEPLALLNPERFELAMNSFWRVVKGILSRQEDAHTPIGS